MRITCFLPGSLTHLLLSFKYLMTLGLLPFCLLLTGCGGGDGKKSSSSSSFSYSFSSVAISSNGTGTWPSVKVDAPLAKTLNFSWSPVDGASYYKLLKNDGSGFVELGGNITGTSASDTIAVHLHDWINTRYLVQWCDVNNVCQNSNNTYTATEMIKSIGLVRASNGEANDFFGWSVALSGDGQTLAVGAPAEDSNATGVNGDQTSNTSQDSGAVYVFVNQNGLWVQQAYLKASNTEQPSVNPSRFFPNDRFGYKVAISDDGNTLAVSAIHEDSPSYGVNCNQANYERTIYTTVVSSSSNSSSNSSSSSSLGTNDVAIIGFGFNMGAVYVFKRTGQVWEQDAYIKPSFTQTYVDLDHELLFGESLAISGDGKTIAVGTTTDLFQSIDTFNIDNFSNSSQACLDYSALDPITTISSSSTSISGSSLSSSSSSSSISSSSSFNSSVKIRGGLYSGAVFTFTKINDNWQPEAFIKASNAEGEIQRNMGSGLQQVDSGDLFGASIALSKDGNWLVVGAPGEDSGSIGVNGTNQENTCYYITKDPFKYDDDCSKFLRESKRLNNGAAYLFNRTNGDWAQTHYLKPATRIPGSAFGTSVDIADDASTVAVGAIGDYSKAGIVNNSTLEESFDLNIANSGAAYIFVRTENQWTQQAFLKPEVKLENYAFGIEVKLSANGDVLAVGSQFESSNAIGINGNPGNTEATGAGAMHIFKRSASQWSQSTYVKASDTEAQDRFGTHAALSDDGKTLTVGAHRKIGLASSQSSSASSAPREATGAVYIY